MCRLLAPPRPPPQPPPARAQCGCGLLRPGVPASHGEQFPRSGVAVSQHLVQPAHSSRFLFPTATAYNSRGLSTGPVPRRALSRGPAAGCCFPAWGGWRGPAALQLAEQVGQEGVQQGQAPRRAPQAAGGDAAVEPRRCRGALVTTAPGAHPLSRSSQPCCWRSCASPGSPNTACRLSWGEKCPQRCAQGAERIISAGSSAEVR